MAQSYLMTADSFEQQKNMKAGALTAGICVLLALMLFFVSWQLPKIVPPDPPLDQQGIEVNLGTDETGFGDVQPLAVGDPAPESATSNAQPAVSEPTETNATDDAESNVAVPKSEKPKVVTTKPVVNPTPAPPKPKAKMGAITTKNGTGPGGNNSQDDFEKNRSQGIYKGAGKDQGDINGTPNSDKYGPGGGKGTGGIVIRSGLNGRRLTSSTAFQDEFKENAKVAVDVIVDASGKVISASINPKGTTTTDGNTRNIAKRRALSLKFNSAGDEQNGTLVFEFKIKG